MFRLITVFIFIASVGSFASCTTRSVVHRGDAPVAISSSETSCQVVAESTQWQALWDMYRIYDADFSAHSFQANKTYNYQMEDRWMDWLINGTVGFLTTVTRHTVLLQECQQEVVIRTPEQIQKQVDDTIARHLQDIGTTRRNKQQPIFILKDDNSHQGRVTEVREDSIEIEVEVRPEGSESEDGDSAGTVDRIRLKSGDIIDGRVVDQDRTSMTILLKDPEGAPRKTISKSDIAQVQFGVPADEAAKRETKRISIHRDSIERIAIPDA